MSYASRLLAVIAAPTTAEKARLLAEIVEPEDREHWDAGPLPARPGRSMAFVESAEPPRRRRSLAHPPSRARFLHAIHHIELSAVDLAALLCLRAAGAPAALHRDFLAIAREEAVHAGLLEAWLVDHGCAPGTHPIHHKLWDAALAAEDLGEQLVVVPRYLEARGLDVSAELAPRLSAIDPEAGAIIARIYRDEIEHVAVGTRWHAWWCSERGCLPEDHFRAVVRAHFPNQLPSPFALDRVGRCRAGFSEADLTVLEQDAMGSGRPGGWRIADGG
jgi:uncharacterized ferritin-like protein (DUF455 family)